MTNLVTSWLSLYPDLESARDAINAELGLHTNSSRVRQWRDGKHPIPQTVQDIMRVEILTHKSHWDIYNKADPLACADILIKLIALPERK